MSALIERSRKKIEKFWGAESWEAFIKLSQFLCGLNFYGPTSFSEPQFTSYYIDPYQSLRVLFSVSTFSADDFGNAKFDAGLSLWSKTLFDSAIETDPWYSYKKPKFSPDKCIKGYVPCLNINLSYMKWTMVEGRNPYWVMTLAGMDELIDDFSAYFTPIIRSLNNDKDLRDLMIRFLEEDRPKWVLSDRPGDRRDLNAMIEVFD